MDGVKDMFGVKTAIERVIQREVSVLFAARHANRYTQDTHIAAAEAIEKFVASLYVSGHIERKFYVETSHMSVGRIKVLFSVNGHNSQVDYLMPNELRQPSSTFSSSASLTSAPELTVDAIASELIEAYERAKKYTHPC